MNDSLKYSKSKSIELLDAMFSYCDFLNDGGIPSRVFQACRESIQFKLLKGPKGWKSYWAPNFGSGIPITMKPDPVHQATYIFHDLAHTILPDATPWIDSEAEYIMSKLLGEAVSLCIADGLFVSQMEAQGVNYDYTSRKFYPWFKWELENGTEFQEIVRKVAMLAIWDVTPTGSNPHIEDVCKYRWLFRWDVVWNHHIYTQFANCGECPRPEALNEFHVIGSFTFDQLFSRYMDHVMNPPIPDTTLAENAFSNIQAPTGWMGIYAPIQIVDYNNPPPIDTYMSILDSIQWVNPLSDAPYQATILSKVYTLPKGVEEIKTLISESGINLSQYQRIIDPCAGNSEFLKGGLPINEQYDIAPENPDIIALDLFELKVDDPEKVAIIASVPFGEMRKLVVPSVVALAEQCDLLIAIVSHRKLDELRELFPKMQVLGYVTKFNVPNLSHPLITISR